jgi:uncharacterized tellurite resistance protein B-like protein
LHVLGLAQTSERSEIPEKYKWDLSNPINENFSREEKLKIMEAAWKIIYADEKLDKYEDHYVHFLADPLRPRHADFIDAKLRILHGDDES